MVTLAGVRRLIVFGIAFFLGCLVLLLFLWTIRAVLIVAFLSLMLAATMRRPALWLSRWIGWSSAVVLLHLLLLLGLGGLVLLFIPTLIAQLLAFFESLPAYILQVRGWGSVVEQVLADLGLAPGLPLEPQQFTGFLVELLQPVLLVPINVLTGVVAFFSLIALSLYFLLDRDHLLRLALAFMPEARRPVAMHLIEQVEANLSAYVWGQAVLSLIVGMLTFAGLLALNVRFALLLAIFAALMEVIPTLGPIIAGLPAVLVALSQSFWLGVAVLVLYVVVQQVEAYVFVPKVQEAAVRLSPYLILLAILVGGSLWGIVGALVAVPLAVTLGVILTAVRSSLVDLGEALLQALGSRLTEPAEGDGTQAPGSSA